MSLKVDIGAASYYSELMQIQTLDNLLSKGIIQDAELYLEQIPDAYIPGKAKLIAALKDKQQMAMPQKIKTSSQLQAAVQLPQVM